MKLNPQQAPLYGECVLTVQLDDEDVCRAEGEEEEEGEFYLLFSGSTQRHLTSTLRVSHVTLQAVCPAHNVCEQVLVTLCVARPDGPVDTHSQETFCFLKDLALDMAHFLLFNTSPQEALLLDDEQIPLKECERLDQNLALALKHLTLAHQRTAPSHTLSQTDEGNRTVTNTHSYTEGLQDTRLDASTLLDSCSAVSQCQQVSSLLHLAASHGLSTVASFLLQQPGGREALRRPSAQGLTPACLAESKGHQQLVELFTQYETSSNVQVEPNKHFCPEGRAFQHNASLGTYTLTFSCHHQRKGVRVDWCIQEEVKELRRLTRLHRSQKGNVTTTNERGSPPLLEEKSQGEDSAGVTSTSGGSVCQSQEAEGEQKHTPAANSSAGRNRKRKKKRTKAQNTRNATDSSGHNRSTSESSRGTALKPTKTTGSRTKTTFSLREPAVASVIDDGGSTKTPKTEETPSPTNPVCPHGGGEICDGRKAVALPTLVAEKQEGEKWEVDMPICEQVVETKNVTEAEHGDTEGLRSKEVTINTALEPAAERTVTMGQEQSQDPQESQSEPGEPNQPDSRNTSPQSGRRTSSKSPDMEQLKPRLDGGWIGSGVGSSPRGPVARTVWYQGENLEQGLSEEQHREEVNSQSVWYYSDPTDQKKHEQLEQGMTEQKECDWSSPQASGLSSQQLLEQGPSSQQPSAARSQPHAAGTQPALSHGPGEQRREVHGSQQQEEVGPDWEVGRVKGDREEASNRETTCSRKSSESASIEEGDEEKQGEEERGAKGGKKRKRKRGKRGGTEYKLSSSSSIESQSQVEIQTQREQEINQSTLSETEPEAKESFSVDKDAMHLPSQTRDVPGPDCHPSSNTGISSADLTKVAAQRTLEAKDVTEGESCSFHGPDHFPPDSTVTASELCEIYITETDVEETANVEPVEKEVLELKRPTCSAQQTLDNVESAASSGDVWTFADGAAACVDLGLLESGPEEPLGHSDPTEFTQESFHVEYPDLNTQHVQSVASDKTVQAVDPMGSAAGFRESAYPLEAELLEDMSLLPTRKERAETTPGKYLEHCPASEVLINQQHMEEKTHYLLMDEQEGKESRWKRSEEDDSDGKEKVEDEEFPSLEGEKQKYNEELVATAVAVVTVAIASAMASIELSRQLEDDPTESRESASKEPANDQPQDDSVSGRTIKQPVDHSDTDTCHLFVKSPPTETHQREQAHIEPTDHFTGRAELPAAPLSGDQEADLHMSAPAPICALPETREDIQTEKTHLTEHLIAKEEDGLLQVNMTPKETSEADSQGQVSQLSCPEASGTLCPDSEHRDPPNQICHKESGTQAESDGQLLHPRDGDDSQPIVRCEEEAGGQTHEQCKAEEQKDGAKEEESHPRLDGAGQTACCPTRTVTPCDFAPVADPSSEQLTNTVGVGTCKYQTPQSSVDLPAPGSGKGLESNESNVFNDKDRNLEPEEEARREMVAVVNTCQTDGETCPAAKEESQHRRSDSTHTLQIQRESDVYFPVQHCPEPSTVTPCGDGHPGREECVSMLLLHRDKETVRVSDELDDGVFKKPVGVPPGVGHQDKGVCVSKDSLIQGGLSPSECTAVPPLRSRLSWKSETEDRGGGETQGRGGEEEEEEEEEENEDQLPENPVSSAILRASNHSLSQFRRHSWEPGKNYAAGDGDITERSSLKCLSAETKRAKPPLHRRSMSWCPSNLCRPDQKQNDNRSYSLEGLEVEKEVGLAQCPILRDHRERAVGVESQERGSLVSLTEEEQEGDGSSQASHQVLSLTTSCPPAFNHPSLTKSVSMVTISHRDIDVGGFPRSMRRISFSLSIPPLLQKNRGFFSIGSSDEEEERGRLSSFSSNSGSLEYSISEEEPGPLRSDTEGKGGPKISRTFSYLRSKMSKKGKEKEKERKGERERENKERDNRSANGHLFIPVSAPFTACQHCIKLLNNKETFLCNNCGVHVHKNCRESLPVCTKSKTKQQSLALEAVPGSAVNMRNKSTSSTSSVSSTSSSSSREHWSLVTTPDDQLPMVFPRRHPSIFNPHSNLAKSISTTNIAGFDDVPLKGLKFLSQSTDSLHQGSKVTASTESLTDEGTEMMDSQLMGEFEYDMKDLEADSWSGTVDKKFLKAQKKDEIKRQDVIYELYQTEFHHVRTLKIMSEVYYKGLQKDLQLDTHTLDKMFPVLDNLVDLHTHFLTLLLERKRASLAEGLNSFLICSIGDVLVQQFSGCSADRMQKVYGKFCSRHNEAVNLYKDLHAKDKRFQAFIKRTMSSSVVRRLSIPECILLVTQRITKYPVLIQRILQHTKDLHEDHSCVCEALRCVKELITAVDSKVNEQEKKKRLREVYSRTDSKSIMRMKSGQMFAKEDLIRGRKLLHDGALQLKNSAGRLKDVHAMLLSDVLVFLQEKDQKYLFASLDQRSTVISLQNLIVREVANEERGLFLITAGTERPEMVEVLASSKEERNTWRAFIQDAMQCMEKDEDEGVPSETEEDRKQQENRAKEIRGLLRKKDEQIICLLEEKVHIFRNLGECNSTPDDTNPPVRERMLFRATPDDVTKGEPIIKDALREVETLHALVHSGVGGAGCSVLVAVAGAGMGPVCLPRRAETFGGFDSHQMNSSKNGEKDEGDESLDLRRTESDSVLKKGATASLQMLLKRSNEQVQHSVAYLHDLLISLQAVVVQQDSFIEEQQQTLSDRLTANSSRNSSSSSLSSSSSRPSSLIEQEKHRSLERQRQEAASLQKQQAAHQEEKKRREKVWDLKEKGLAEWEERLRVEEEETSRRRQELHEERETLQRKKEEYQRDLERLREAQRRLERDSEGLRRDAERLDSMKKDQSEQFQRHQRISSTTSEDSIRLHSYRSLDLNSRPAVEEPKEVELSSSAPTKEPFLRIGSKRMGKNFNPFSSSSSSSKPEGAEKESQLPSRLLQLTKPKEKKDKKKKKGKGKEEEQTQTESELTSDPQNDGDIFFC